MFCNKCGAKNEEGSKFCSGCGAPLSEKKSNKTSNKANEVLQEEKNYTESAYSYKPSARGESRGFGTASWVFTSLLILKSFVMLVSILVYVLSTGSQNANIALSYILYVFTWTSVSSVLGYVLTGFEIVFALVFGLVQFFRAKKSNFSKYCLAFAVIMSVLAIILLIIYPIFVPTIS